MHRCDISSLCVQLSRRYCSQLTTVKSDIKNEGLTLLKQRVFKSPGISISRNSRKEFNTEIQIFSILYVIIYLIPCSQHVNWPICGYMHMLVNTIKVNVHCVICQHFGGNSNLVTVCTFVSSIITEGKFCFLW